MKLLSVSPKWVSFGRAPTKDEEPLIEKDIKEAKEFLGIKNQAVILHGSSFPVSDKDLYIGSPINEEAKDVNKFFKMFGFDSIQLGPSGLLPEGDNSPYSASSTSENYLFSDMNKLTGKTYGGILSSKDISEETNSMYINNSGKTNFAQARKSYDRLFEK